jgi:hypothetical protein
VERLPGLGCHAEGQRGEVGVIGWGAVKARVRPAAIVGDLSVGAHARRRVDCRTAPGRGRSATHANGARLLNARSTDRLEDLGWRLRRHRVSRIDEQSEAAVDWEQPRACLRQGGLPESCSRRACVSDFKTAGIAVGARQLGFNPIDISAAGICRSQNVDKVRSGATKLDAVAPRRRKNAAAPDRESRVGREDVPQPHQVEPGRGA